MVTKNDYPPSFYDKIDKICGKPKNKHTKIGNIAWYAFSLLCLILILEVLFD